MGPSDGEAVQRRRQAELDRFAGRRRRFSAKHEAPPIPTYGAGGHATEDAGEKPHSRGRPAIHLQPCRHVRRGGDIGARRGERLGAADLDTHVTPLAEGRGRAHYDYQEDHSRRAGKTGAPGPAGVTRYAGAPADASGTHAHSVLGGATARTALRLPKPSSA